MNLCQSYSNIGMRSDQELTGELWKGGNRPDLAFITHLPDFTHDDHIARATGLAYEPLLRSPKPSMCFKTEEQIVSGSMFHESNDPVSIPSDSTLKFQNR